MGHVEGNRCSLNEILERASEAPGVMELVMICQHHGQVLIFLPGERWLLALTNGRGLKEGGGENKIFCVFVKPKQKLMGNLEKNSLQFTPNTIYSKKK